MSLLCFFDTETTSLPIWKEPSDHPSQPHLVELAAVLVDTESREEVDAYTRLVRPDGWTIPAETAAVHGIMTERALAEGDPEDDVIERFLAMADEANGLAAFNIDFDLRIMRIAMLRFGMTKSLCDAWQARQRPLCLMRASTPFCKLPPTDKMMAAGRRGFKNPKLAEACEALLGEKVEGVHAALVDVRATVRIWCKLQDLTAAAGGRAS